MADGSSAISDWPILDALLLSATGADLVAVHAGGAGYAGYMQSAGVTIVADGTEAAGRRLRHGLDADTGLGVLRYADAGYPAARAAAAAGGLGLQRPDGAQPPDEQGLLSLEDGVPSRAAGRSDRRAGCRQTSSARRHSAAACKERGGRR